VYICIGKGEQETYLVGQKPPCVNFAPNKEQHLAVCVDF